MNERIRSVLKRLEDQSHLEKSRVVDVPSEDRMLAITPDTGQFYNILLRAIKAKKVLEIGTSVGYSALWFADAILDHEGEIITIEQNAAKIGVANPFDRAADVIADLESQFADISLDLAEFPVFANPLETILQDTPLGPTTLNLPSIDANAVSAQVQGSNYNNLTTQQKLDLLFG